MGGERSPNLFLDREYMAGAGEVSFIIYKVQREYLLGDLLQCNNNS